MKTNINILMYSKNPEASASYWELTFFDDFLAEMAENGWDHKLLINPPIRQALTLCEEYNYALLTDEEVQRVIAICGTEPEEFEPECWILQVVGDVEPILHKVKPELLIRKAKELREEDGDLRDGLYKVFLKGESLEISSFTGFELDDNPINEVNEPDRTEYASHRHPSGAYTKQICVICRNTFEKDMLEALLCLDDQPICPTCKKDRLQEPPSLYQTSLFTREQMSGSGQLNMLDQIERTQDLISRLKKTSILVIDDGGHAWFRVSFSDLKALGIHKAISSSSYKKGDEVWLEEDCDIVPYLQALFGANISDHPDYPNWKAGIREESVNYPAHVRSLPHYPDRF